MIAAAITMSDLRYQVFRKVMLLAGFASKTCLPDRVFIQMGLPQNLVRLLSGNVQKFMVFTYASAAIMTVSTAVKFSHDCVYQMSRAPNVQCTPLENYFVILLLRIPSALIPDN